MRRQITTTLIALLFAILASDADAEVTRLEILRREAYAEGREFDSVGAYERLLGRVHFVIDPEIEANRQIVDLELAPRNADARVEFSADFEILAPVDLNRANGALLYDVNNRGNRVCLRVFNVGADEFLMRNGYIVVWSGWIAETLPGGGRLRLDAPVATDEGRTITGIVRAEMAPNEPADRLNIAHWANQGSYAPTERGLAEATLTWRLRESDPRVPIPRSQWRLEQTEVTADGQTDSLPQIDLVLAGGFQPGYLYELIYETQGPIVQGLGLAGIRDLVSMLKHNESETNPLRLSDGAPAVKRTLGFGVSQSGRCLRMFLYDGFNADEQGRQVFDGLMPHVAGAGLGFFNHRFASPTRHNSQHDNHLYPADVFPFAYGEETDPFTGRTEGILRPARQSATVPKVMHTQSSAEYWHRSGSLVHTDPLGERDSEIPSEVRVYGLGGAQHGPGDGVPRERSDGQLPSNPTDYRPLMRALLTALDAWVRDGTLPPPSRYPRISDGTLVGWREPQSGWSALPGVRYPEIIQQPEFLDRGPRFLSQRITTIEPPVSRGRYVVKVPAYAADNNERGMLLAPSVAVPVATFTGWNLRHRSIGAETELLSLRGAYILFAKTGDERQAKGDPRPALLERYRDFHDYLGQFTEATRELIDAGFLLPEEEASQLDYARRQRELFE